MVTKIIVSPNVLPKVILTGIKNNFKSHLLMNVYRPNLVYGFIVLSYSIICTTKLPIFPVSIVPTYPAPMLFVWRISTILLLL